MDKAKLLKKLIPVMAVFGLIGQASAAFNFAGMDNLSNIIKDVVTLVPDLITLAVYAGILTIVGALIAWITGFFKKGGMGK